MRYLYTGQKSFWNLECDILLLNWLASDNSISNAPFIQGLQIHKKFSNTEAYFISTITSNIMLATSKEIR